MTAEIIDGLRRAEELKRLLAAELLELADARSPVGLATLQVGSEYSASAYARRLGGLAREVGVAHRECRLAEDVSQAELLELIADLNHDPAITGILVLRPLPAAIDESAVFSALDPGKDIESVHPCNAGLLALGTPRFVPSTAAAAYHLLDAYLDDAEEDRAAFYHRSLILVVGRSNNVGKPCVALGFRREASVASVDEWASATGRLADHTRRADVLIVAAGRPGLIRAEHVSERTIVIDVGINAHTDEDGRTRMVGDVDAESVAEVARALTPVPGGVGPLTDVWLLRNTIHAARLAAGEDRPGAPLPTAAGRSGALEAR